MMHVTSILCKLGPILKQALQLHERMQIVAKAHIVHSVCAVDMSAVGCVMQAVKLSLQ